MSLPLGRNAHNNSLLGHVFQVYQQYCGERRQIESYSCIAVDKSEQVLMHIMKICMKHTEEKFLFSLFSGYKLVTYLVTLIFLNLYCIHGIISARIRNIDSFGGDIPDKQRKYTCLSNLLPIESIIFL